MTSGETWRPLGVDSDEEIAEYDALHDGVPTWMQAAFWAWVKDEITEYRSYRDRSGRIPHLSESFTESMCQRLRLPLPDVRVNYTDYSAGERQIQTAMAVLKKGKIGLRIADYILANGAQPNSLILDELLARSKSAWKVGVRQGRPGLTRRVPLGVQSGADQVMGRAGRAGVRLASAWENLYGLDPNASEAYRLAILAVEDASIPVVSPTNSRATLGTVLKQMEDQGDWSLSMSREDPRSPSGDVVVHTMRLLWHGQHDRHGGQPSGPGNVTIEEATVAVGIATTLVQWFDAGLVARRPKHGVSTTSGTERQSEE